MFFSIKVLKKTFFNDHIITSIEDILSNKFPFDPLPSRKSVLEQIVSVGKVRIGMNIASIAAEHKHGGLVNLYPTVMFVCSQLDLLQKFFKLYINLPQQSGGSGELEADRC